jgi:hypothetical protein
LSSFQHQRRRDARGERPEHISDDAARDPSDGQRGQMIVTRQVAHVHDRPIHAINRVRRHTPIQRPHPADGPPRQTAQPVPQRLPRRAQLPSDRAAARAGTPPLQRRDAGTAGVEPQRQAHHAALLTCEDVRPPAAWPRRARKIRIFRYP